MIHQPFSINNHSFHNRVVFQPMEGCDCLFDGTPSDYTIRKYMRFAAGGSGLIWFEANAVCPEGRANPRQLMLTAENLDVFKKLVDDVREKALKETGFVPQLILQLTHSGRQSVTPLTMYKNEVYEATGKTGPIATDDYLDRLPEFYIKSTRLAEEAGFDGIDIKACHGYLLMEAMSAFTREGKYGGGFENRTRLYKDVIAAVKAELGGKIAVATRLGVHDAIGYPYGFCDNTEDAQKFEPEEAIRLIGEIHALGVNLINVTMGTPYFNPHVNRPYCKGGYEPPEHPLVGVERMLSGAALLTKQFPDITFIGTGYTFLRQFAPYLAAGAVESGMISAAGFGRMAFAYDGFAKDLIAGDMKVNKCCVTCGKCTELMRAYTTTGCPVRDSEMYAPIYKDACLNK